MIVDIRQYIILLEDEIGLLTADQREIVERALAGCSRFIYGDLLDKHAVQIFAYQGWDLDKDGGVPRGVFVSGPRRLGKTRIFSILLAVLLISVPGITILGLAAEKGPAETLCAEVHEKVQMLIKKTHRGTITRCAKEHLYVSVADKTSKLHVFSARKDDG